MPISLSYHTPGGLSLVERAGRICYNSEDLITEGSYAPFIAGCVRNGHGTVLEHKRMLWDVMMYEGHVLDMIISSPFMRMTRNRHDRTKMRFWVTNNSRSIMRSRGTLIGDMMDREAGQQFPCLFGTPDLSDDGPPQDAGHAENVTLISSFIPPMLEEDSRGLMVHSAFTFLIEGVSRTCSHQLVRHRDATFGQAQQRHGKAIGDLSFKVPGSIRSDRELEEVYEECNQLSVDTFRLLKGAGVPQEDARFVLPSAITTRLIVTIPAESLLNFLLLREDRHAQWEIRHVADQMRYLVPQIKEWSGQ